MRCGHGCNSGCGICTESCECQRCSGIDSDLLAPPTNRPGLTALATRIGDYRTFFDDAIRRLTSREAPMLQALGTRDPTDATVALLDAWSIVADVLTFYRERLTNEGYLRTATDERSLRELASLVGFKLRPGVAATVHLAYLLEPSAAPVDIPIGAKAQTVPLPGEKMQTFETDEALSARAEWSEMKPRQTRPPLIDRVDALMRPTIRLTDTTLVVRSGERVLFVFGMQPGQQVVREVLSSKINVEQGYVELTLKPRAGFSNDLAKRLVRETDEIQKALRTLPAPVNDDTEAKLKELMAIVTSSLLGNDGAKNAKEHCERLAEPEDAIVKPLAEACSDIFKEIAGSKLSAPTTVKATSLDDVLTALQTAPARQLRSGKLLSQEAKDGLGTTGDKRFRLMQSITPILQDVVYQALDAMPANPVPATAPAVYLLRTVSSPFGAVAPPKMSGTGDTFRMTEWLLEDMDKGAAFLETVVDTITADSLAIVDTPWFVTVAGDVTSPDRLLRFARVRSSQTVPRGNYNVNGKVTRLDLAEPETGDDLPVVVKKL